MSQRNEHVNVMPKIPEDCRTRLLQMINLYYSLRNRAARDSLAEMLMLNEITFYIMRFWERGFISAKECNAMLKDVDAEYHI